MGTLLYRRDRIYEFTAEDRDLLVRAMWGESGERSTSTREGLAVACTMIQRWAMLLTLPWYRAVLARRPDAAVYGYTAFSDFLAAYSQPVNPAWLNGGRKDRDPDTIDPAEQRRDWIQTRPITSFSPAVRALVSAILDGESLRDGVPADMRGLVHFYCPAIYYARSLGQRLRDLTDNAVDDASRRAFGHGPGLIWSQPQGVSARSNAFYRIKRTKRWGADRVKVVP